MLDADYSSRFGFEDGHKVSTTDLARVTLKAELVQEAYERVGDRWDVRGMVRYLRESSSASTSQTMATVRKVVPAHGRMTKSYEKRSLRL